MVEKENSGKYVADAIERALRGFGTCVKMVCDELSCLEEENKALKKRVDTLEGWRRLVLACAATAKVAEGTFEFVPDVEVEN